MNKCLKKLLGEGTYPFPLDDLGKIFALYPGDKMLFGVLKTAMKMPAGSHCHSSYEFIIPLTPMVPAKVEKREFTVERHKLFPFNSEQAHGPAVESSGYRFMSLMIDNNFINDICRSVYGRTEVCFKNDNFIISNEIHNLFRLFMEEAVNQQTGHKFILESLSTQIVVNLLRHVKNNMPVCVKERNYVARENINKVIDFIKENYIGEYSLEEMARLANISPYHFIRVFKAQTGKTPHEYLLEIKLENARELLKKSSLTITEISSLCGFNSLSHFTTLFRRKTGVTPSYYRNVL